MFFKKAQKVKISEEELMLDAATDIIVGQQETIYRLQQKLEEYEERENQVYNLTLYLDYVRAHDKKLWREMMKYFDGMPGFSNCKVSIRIIRH